MEQPASAKPVKTTICLVSICICKLDLHEKTRFFKGTFLIDILIRENIILLIPTSHKLLLPTFPPLSSPDRPFVGTSRHGARSTCGTCERLGDSCMYVRKYV